MGKPIKKTWVKCEFCGKILAERRPNGILAFSFGSRFDPVERDKRIGFVVHMEIYGSIRMRCLRGSCFQWNTINFFPFKKDPDVPQQSPTLTSTATVSSDTPVTE